MIKIRKIFGKVFKQYLKMITKVDDKRVTLVRYSYSGSNAYALYRFMPGEIKEEGIKVQLMDFRFASNEDTNGIVESFFQKVRFYRKIYESKVIMYSQGFLDKNRKSIFINLWHGFPIKTMDMMDKGEDIKMVRRKLQILSKNVDYIISYSTLFNTLINACFCYKATKYVITGAPRNDFLYYADGRYNLNRMYNVSFNRNEKLVIYMPTYRFSGRDRKQGKLVLEILVENLEMLSKFLEHINAYLFVKLHPFEEQRVLKVLGLNSFSYQLSERIFLISNRLLGKNDLDLYEVLNGFDILVTDYSSVYFDYLLLDRPVIFYIPDVEVYKRDRGFLLEPLDFWMPGPKVETVRELMRAIDNSLKHPDKYRAEREIIKNIIHKYQDANSSKRVWEFISGLIGG